MLRIADLFHAQQRLESVDFRHYEVEQHGIHGNLHERGQTFLAIAREDGQITAGFQDLPQQFAGNGLVIDYQDPGPIMGTGPDVLLNGVEEQLLIDGLGQEFRGA